MVAAGRRGVGVLLPGYDKEHAADPQVGEEDVHPDVGRQGVEEGEHAGVGPVGLAVQNADPQGHEGLGEVDRFLPDVGDGERSDGQISFLCVTRRERDTKGEKKKPLESCCHPSEALCLPSTPRCGVGLVPGTRNGAGKS